MTIPKEDIVLLMDIYKAIKIIIRFTDGIEYDDYAENILIFSTIERQFEIIGEASRNISNETKSLFTEIPWRSIIGLRNIISHGYGSIDNYEIWIIVKTHVPKLLSELHKIEELKPYINKEKK